MSISEVGVWGWRGHTQVLKINLLLRNGFTGGGSWGGGGGGAIVKYICVGQGAEGGAGQSVAGHKA